MSAAGDGLRIDDTPHGDYRVVYPSGTLDVDSYPGLRDSLLKYAADVPEALIVVMDSLHVEREHLLSVFSLAWMRVADWPGIPVVLLARDHARRQALQRGAVSRYVPVHADLADAEQSLAGLPTRYRLQATLHDTATASARGRALAREACAQWGVEVLSQDATMVVTELVENSLKHTDSAPALRLELRRGLLSVAATDDSPARARLRESNGQSSRGLRLVAQTARVWGCTPTLAGGKVVWAVLGTGRSGARSSPEWTEYAG